MVETKIGPGEEDPFPELLDSQVASDFKRDDGVDICSASKVNSIVVEGCFNEPEWSLVDISAGMLASTPGMIVVGVATKPVALETLLLHSWHCMIFVARCGKCTCNGYIRSVQ